ncbi:MAG: tRNA uridine-5-carboxymethylaminomethyl(34) synthesis GTPase MnmE [Elusimicrobia bacterium]|nr:tRNA uridine-5-carboxymethylaminomethyl(34) synthesis GTPase MnmE [Elusimicrobiota bacterium]
MGGKSDTIAAIATPPGVGALGILRLSGPSAREVASRFLKVGGEGLSPKRAVVCRADFDGSPLDRVVVVYHPGPATSTGEELIEITAHGSAFILGRLLAAALASGARAALPGEFTQRAFLNGRLDLSQAEAVCDLIRARTGRSHRAALEQLEGGLSREVRGLSSSLTDLLVRVEASLDHPEEDIPIVEPGAALCELEAGRSRVLTLARTFKNGRLLAEGARVAIVGRPNAGKSSLLNALLGMERAIVCASPGTTRDTLEEPCDLGGIPAVLIDTAGLTDHPADEAESLGLERTDRALERCDLALLVVDGSRPSGPEDEAASRRILERLASLGRPALTVRNKADLPSAAETPEAPACDAAVSARTGLGLRDLVARIGPLLGDSPGEQDGVTVTSGRHHAALLACASELAAAGRSVTERPGAWEELAASGLRAALRELGSITGEDAPASVLSAIFARFCVGK